MAIDPNIVTENLIGSNESENPIDTTITEKDMMGAEELNPIPEEQPVFEEVEVAGRFTPKPKLAVKIQEEFNKVKDDLTKKTDEASEKLQPQGPVDNVTVDRDRIVVRGIDDDELKNLEEYLPKHKENVEFVSIIDEQSKNIPGINGDSLNSLFQNIKIHNKEMFEAAKRGNISMEDMLKMAEKNGIIKNASKFLNRKPGEVLPAEDFLAGILAVINWRTEIDKALSIRRTINDPVVKKQQMEEIGRMMALEVKLTSELNANLSEYGRGLAVTRHLANLDLNLADRSAQLNGWMQGFDSEQSFEYMLDTYSVLPASGKKVFLERSLFGRTLDAVVEGYILGVLTSFRTHAVNIASTGINNAVQIPIDIVSSGIGYARQSLGGTGERQRIGEFIARADGMRLTFFDALLLSGKSWIKDEPSDFRSKIDLQTRKALTAEKFNLDSDTFWGRIFDWMGTYNRLSGRFLVAEDEFFKVLGGAGEARVLALRRSMDLYYKALPRVGKEEAKKLQRNEFERLMNDLPQDIRNEAQDAARYFAFQEDIEGTLGNLANFMAHPAVKIFGTAFVKTPTNVIGQTLQYTPAGIPRVYKNLKSGDPIAADRALAKVAIGTGTMAALSYLTWNGGYGEDVFITGHGPTDYKARESWKRKGLLPYSLCARDGPDDPYECTSYARFEPVSGILAIAADFTYYMQHEENAETLAEMGQFAAIAMATYADSMPMLEGLSQITEIMNGVLYPTGMDKASRLMEVMTEKMTNAVLAGTPTFGAFARSIEAYIDQDASGYSIPASGYAFPNSSGPLISELDPASAGFYRALQKGMASNPFFSDKVPPKLNRWAEVVPQGNGEFWEIFSPIRRSYEKNGLYSEFDETLMMLGGGIDMPSKKVSGVKLNAVQYNQLLEIAAHIDNQGFLPAGVLGKVSDDVGYKADQALYSSIKKTMEMPYYLNKTVSYYGKNVIEETTNEEKVAYINNVVRQADTRALYYLKQMDSTLNDLINLRE